MKYRIMLFFTLIACLLSFGVTSFISAPKASTNSKQPKEKQASQESVYTIQTGSFRDSQKAEKQFRIIKQSLEGAALRALRIERIRKFYAVRVGRFASLAEAEQFLSEHELSLEGAMVMKAYFIYERILLIHDGVKEDVPEGKAGIQRDRYLPDIPYAPNDLGLKLVGTALVNAEMTTSQIAKKYSSSVVTIVALDENDQPLALGSGFFINDNGDIATNHHVLEGSVKAIIKTTNGDKGNVLEIIKDDPELDLIVARTSLKNTKPLPIGDSDTITVGEDIVAIGNPAGLEGTISKGIISGIRKVDDYKFIQITAPISPGSSGGPVFDLSGKVIGVATAYLDTGQNLNFAMPVNYLKSLKQSKYRIASLPKADLKIDTKDKSLVKVIDIHLNRCGTSLCDIDFSVTNDSNYSIENVMLFFIYKKHKVQYSDEYHTHITDLITTSKYDEMREYKRTAKPEKEWDEVISYSTKKINKKILPKMGLQFNHSHTVNHYYYMSGSSHYTNAYVEVRILDYEIDRTPGSSPAELLFK